MSTTDRRARTWRVNSPDDLGRALASVRRSRGVSQGELAAMLDVHRSYIAELEAGGSVQMLERLLRAFKRLGAEVEIRLPPVGDG
jgi:transcriptional regulator with XRE-family HTH domain